MIWRCAGAVLIRPWLWPAAIRFVPPGWWRRWPPLPLPPREYIEFRLETAYGSKQARPKPEEVVQFLSWCRRMKKIR